MKTTLRLLTLALTLLGAGASASTFYGYRAPLPNVTITAPDNLLGFKVTVTTGGALQAFGANFRAPSGEGSMGLYAADGANGDPGTLRAQTGSFAIDAAGTLELPPEGPVTLAAGDYWIMGVFSQNAYPGYDYSAANVIKYRALPFSATLPGTFGATATYPGGKFNYYIKVAGSIHAVLYARGAKVPGAGDPGAGIPADAEFETFGSPKINALGDVAFRAACTSGPPTIGAGYFVHSFNVGLNDHLELLAKVGDTVRSGGSVLKSLEDVVGIDEQGTVTFTAVLTGPAAGRARENARKSSCQNNLKSMQAPVVVAEEGQPSPVPGAVWKTLKSTTLGPDGRVLIGGTVSGQGITGKKASVLCATNRAGVLQVVVHEGVTRVRNSGALGGIDWEVQTAGVINNNGSLDLQGDFPRAFNRHGEVVLKVTTADRVQRLVGFYLP